MSTGALLQALDRVFLGLEDHAVLSAHCLVSVDGRGHPRVLLPLVQLGCFVGISNPIFMEINMAASVFFAVAAGVLVNHIGVSTRAITIVIQQVWSCPCVRVFQWIR